MNKVGKLPISVLILPSYDRDQVEACRRSVSWADEVIVLDEDLSQATEGQLRNQAIAQARQDWILSLDANERPSLELKSALQMIITRNQCQAYRIPQANYLNERKLFFREDPKNAVPKFIRRNCRYDEQAEISPKVVTKGKMGCLDQPLKRYPFKDFTDGITKLDYQTDLESRSWIRKERKVSLITVIALMLSRFFTCYVGRKAYRDGVVGLYLSVNEGMYPFLSYAKYWEVRRQQA